MLYLLYHKVIFLYKITKGGFDMENHKHFFKRMLSFATAFSMTAGILSVSEFNSIKANAIENSVSVQSSSSNKARQVESLDRGLVAFKSGNGIFLSWRLLGTESYDTNFAVYKNGVYTATVKDSTNWYDSGAGTNNTYTVRSVVDGVEMTESDPVTPWSQNYLDVSINKPGSIYSANDATVADVDDDGQYEIILKWDPSDSQDNSKSGKTSNVYIDCYELDGTQKWRIDLGKNIRAGAHYTQFIAYDFDGDGKAELAMKTADGTVDGKGNVIGDASKDYRNSNGYILSGSEYLTMFSGETGEALQTIDYTPPRGKVSDWGDSYGNRVDRFLAGVAYLDGKTPSLIMCRGYYTRSVIVAYDFKNGKFSRKWTFDTNSSGNKNYAGQGNHNLSTADVDNDGYDEIVYGSMVVDHNGTGLYSTGNGHGDAMHVGDFDPDHEGLEVFQVHEGKGSSIESVQMRDAKTGKTLWCDKTQSDVGRGLIANIGPDYYPYIATTSAGNYDRNGNKLDLNLGKFGMNFSVYWDADLYQEGLDRTYINKWNYKNKTVDRLLTASNVHSNNSTKATPSLSADIFGDWREEVIWPTSDDTALRIYVSGDVTSHKLYTFMHDTQYREAVAWQNVAYNQPPHPSFYVGEDMKTPSQPNVYTVGSYKEKELNVKPKKGEQITEGKYMIQNVLSGLYLDVKDGKAENGTNVQLWGADQAGSFNTWNIISAGNGYYQLYSCVGDGSYLLDLDYGKTENGTNIQIYKNTNSDAQKFKFVSAGNGQYFIATKSTNDQSNLDAYKRGKANGTNICQWEHTGYQNQIWKLVKVDQSKDDTTEDTSKEVTIFNDYPQFDGDSSDEKEYTFNIKQSGKYKIKLNFQGNTGAYFKVKLDGDPEKLWSAGNWVGNISSSNMWNDNWGTKEATIELAAGNHTISVEGNGYAKYGVCTYTFVSSTHTHTYTSKITKASTCTTDGVMTYSCSCGESYTETIKATGHKYVTTTVAPTIDNKGYDNHKCSVCGDEYNDNYTEKKTVSISECSVSVGSEATFTGSEVTPEIIVKYGQTVLKSGTDYTVTYTNNVKVGTAKITVTGKGIYTGSVTKEFTITSRQIDQCNITLSSNQVTFNGKQQKPKVTLKINGKTVYSGNYTVSYTNNIKVGTATVKITGKGNLTGSITKTFKILPKSLKYCNVTLSGDSFKYTGKAIKPTVKVKISDSTIYAGNYTVSYKNNINKGTATVLIKGTNNLTGSVTKTFTIK